MPRFPFFLALASLLLPLAGSLRAAALVPVGQVVERVVCRDHPDQSYAVFLPAGYDPARRWPVLFCLDPRARGGLPVGLFAAAAARHGFIVAGSNNSQNGPLPPADAAIAAMLLDVSQRWSLDPHRVYVAGFSGGARMATRVGATGMARGVIACGGGFLDASATPERVPFDFGGFAGSEDFNRDELQRIERDLQGQPVAHRLWIFPGEHSWLPEELTDDALSWLDAQYRHAAVRDRYVAFLRATLRRHAAAVDSLPPLAAYQACAALIADGQAWIEVDHLKQQRRQLGREATIKTQGGELERRRAALVKDWRQRARRAGDASAPATLAEWHRLAAADRTAPETRLAAHALASVGLLCCEQAALALAQKGPTPEAARWAAWAEDCFPTEPLPAYNHACVEALLGHPAPALAALERAVRHGFQDAAAARQEPAFTTLQADPAFQALLARMGP